MAERRLCAVNDCGNPARARGLCNRHYLRERAYGSPTAGSPRNAGQQRLGRDCVCEECGATFYAGLGRFREAERKSNRVAYCSVACRGKAARGKPRGSVSERFWTKVERGRDEECWPWRASRLPDGYGQFGFDGAVKRAHRVAYFLTYGDFDKSLEVRHTCDNPPCCNPAHLLTGTHTDNMRDMAERGRAVCRDQKGEANPLSKLTADQVRQIRADRFAGEMVKDIASRYGVTRSAVSMILSGRTWVHVK